MAIFCWHRKKEIIDGLVDLLIQIIHRISVQAEKKVLKELLRDLKKVYGKTTILFKSADLQQSWRSAEAPSKGAVAPGKLLVF